jgi:hypothetical protein
MLVAEYASNLDYGRPEVTPKAKAVSTMAEAAFALTRLNAAYLASGSGRSWKCTTLLIWPLPPSI